MFFLLPSLRWSNTLISLICMVFNKPFYDVTTNKTRSSCYQNFHIFILMSNLLLLKALFSTILECPRILVVKAPIKFDKKLITFKSVLHLNKTEPNPKTASPAPIVSIGLVSKPVN